MKQPIPVIDHFAGLDLGQAHDYSALVLLERSVLSGDRRYSVRGLKRWPLGTPYPEVARSVKASLEKLPPGVRLVVDYTGVGRPVVDIFRELDLPCRLVPVSITGGQAVSGNVNTGLNVPKLELKAVIDVALQNNRLRFADGLPLAKVCRGEMEKFRVKVTPAGNETCAAWREGDHDDILLALACALFLAENEVEPYRGPLCYNEKIPFDPDDVPEEERPRPRYRQVLEDVNVDLEGDW